jgi:hypothetical protein
VQRKVLELRSKPAFAAKSFWIVDKSTVFCSAAQRKFWNLPTNTTQTDCILFCCAAKKVAICQQKHKLTVFVLQHSENLGVFELNWFIFFSTLFLEGIEAQQISLSLNKQQGAGPSPQILVFGMGDRPPLISVAWKWFHNAHVCQSFWCQPVATWITFEQALFGSAPNLALARLLPNKLCANPHHFDFSRSQSRLFKPFGTNFPAELHAQAVHTPPHASFRQESDHGRTPTLCKCAFHVASFWSPSWKISVWENDTTEHFVCGVQIDRNASLVDWERFALNTSAFR